MEKVLGTHSIDAFGSLSLLLQYNTSHRAMRAARWAFERGR